MVFDLLQQGRDLYRRLAHVARALDLRRVRRTVRRPRLRDDPGQPLDPTTTFGPLADASQFSKVSEYVQYGLEDGAHLHLGGKPFHPDGLNGKGYYYLPTIFTEASNEMRIARDEIFGPVLTVIPFSTEEEAIQLANDTDYGLASGIHTLNLKRAHRVARALRAGTVWVNTYNMFDATTPFS